MTIDEIIKDLKRKVEAWKPLTMEAPKMHISKGNAKVGDTDSFSLLPVITCSQYACRTCGKSACYARKSLIYPSARNAWFDNTILARYYPDELWSQLVDYFDNLQKKGKLPKYFRLHVSGDFDNSEYINVWCEIAYRYPQVTFYTYTKSIEMLEQYEHDNGLQWGHNPMPNNLVIKISDWCGVNIAEQYPEICYRHKVAYVDNHEIDYIPKNAYVCKGNGCSSDKSHTCQTCGYMCAYNINVVFPIH